MKPKSILPLMQWLYVLHRFAINDLKINNETTSLIILKKSKWPALS